VVSVLAVLFRAPALLALLTALTIIPWLVMRPPLAHVRWLLVLVVTTVVGTLISQGFFYSLEPRTGLLTILPGLTLWREGIAYGAVVSLRLVSVLAAGSLVVFSTHPSDLILALGKLRVPHAFAFMLTMAIRFLPETIEQGKRILIAQQLRGVTGRGVRSVVKRFRLLVVPLLTISLRSARQIALAAEVRAYSAHRVPARDLRFAVADWLILLGLVCLLISGTVVGLWDRGLFMPGAL
jgi:energy-coupling factor transport system permease protein